MCKFAKILQICFIYSTQYNSGDYDIIVCILIGVEPWTFEQRLGEAVFIPAGCPHQVRNLKVIHKFPTLLLLVLLH